MKRALPFVLIAAVLLAALLAAWFFLRSPGETPSPVANNSVTPPAGPTNSPATSTANDVDPGAEPPHAIGDRNAPVTLEEFGDFQCPPCGALHPILKTMEEEFGSRLRIVFREYPLVPTHEHALTAARAAEAAGLQGKFWPMHDLIYEDQKTWSDAFDVRPIFEAYAKKIGLNVEQWKKDIGSEVVEQRIFLDGKRAHRLGVTGTPTVFLNGREVPFQSLPAEKLRPLIQAEFDRVGK